MYHWNNQLTLCLPHVRHQVQDHICVKCVERILTILSLVMLRVAEELIALDIAIHPRHEKQMRPHQLASFHFLVVSCVLFFPMLDTVMGVIEVICFLLVHCCLQACIFVGIEATLLFEMLV